MLRAGQRLTTTVAGQDEFGNAATAAEGVTPQACLTMYLPDGDPAVPKSESAAVIDRHNGTFEISYDMKLACDFEASIALLVLVCRCQDGSSCKSSRHDFKAP